jgi:hypothetical protein
MHRIPIEVVNRPRILSEPASLGPARVGLDGAPMHDHEERLEPSRDGAADGRVGADVAKPG